MNWRRGMDRPVDAMQLDSVYTRVMDIAGTPVNDSYHFGQTLINDYGRPYWQGVNNITGFSASANDGRFAFYIDGEYQYAPTIPGISAVGPAGDRECRPESGATVHADLRRTSFVAGHLCLREVMEASIFRWANKACGGDRAKAAPC